MKTGVIDIGNTALKAGIFEDRELIDFVYSPEINTLEIFFNGVDSVIVGSVTGIPDNLRRVLKNFDVLFWDKFSDEISLPFDILCNYAQTIGIDRLALVAGALALYPKENVLIISLGTCVTYNMLNSGGGFVPGAISAGLSMRLRAMHRDAPALPNVELNDFRENTGIPINNTETSMLNGCIMGLWYEIQGYIDQYSGEYENLKILLTGGDLKCYDGRVSESLRIFASPNLVLQGLNEILRYNKK